MAKEINIEPRTKEEKEKLTLIKGICICPYCNGKVDATAFTIDEFDYYAIVEKNENKAIIMCWDEDQKMTDGHCFIAEFNK